MKDSSDTELNTNATHISENRLMKTKVVKHKIKGKKKSALKSLKCTNVRSKLADDIGQATVDLANVNLDFAQTDENLIPMSKEYALEIIKSLETNNSSSRKNLYELYIGNAHIAFGYTWDDLCKKELLRVDTPRNIDRQIRAAEVEIKLAVPVGTLSGNATRSLVALLNDPTKLKPAWASACKAHGSDGWPTGAEVEAAVAELKLYEAMLIFLQTKATLKQLREVADVVIAIAPLKGLKYIRKNSLKRIQAVKTQVAPNDGQLAYKHTYSTNQSIDDVTTSTDSTVKRSSNSDGKTGRRKPGRKPLFSAPRHSKSADKSGRKGGSRV